MAKNINNKMATIIKIVVELILPPAFIIFEYRPFELFGMDDNEVVDLLKFTKLFIYKYEKKLTSCKRIIQNYNKDNLKIIKYYL